MSTLHDLPLAAPAEPASLVSPPALRLVPDVPLAFEEAVRALTPRLQRYVVRRLGDRHEAEELVQEALLRAYQHADQLRTEDDLAAWATVVAGRLVIDRLRVRGRSTSVAEVPEGLRRSRDTADVVVARDEARTALDALDAMPPRQAAVLWAREVEGLGYDAIGARYGMTEPAVRSLLSRARKGLRKEFAVRGGTLPAGGLAALAPWVDGLSWLERLRRLGTRAAGPAAIAVVGAGVLGTSLVAPLTFPDAPSARPAVVRASTPATDPVSPPAPLRLPVRVDRTTQTGSTPADAARPAQVQPPSPTLVTRLDEACVGTTSVTVGGYRCGTRGGDEVVLHPLVPIQDPVGVLGDGGVGVELPTPVCAALRPVLPGPGRSASTTTTLPVSCTPEETP